MSEGHRATVVSIVPFRIPGDKPVFPMPEGIPPCLDENEPICVVYEEKSRHVYQLDGVNIPVAVSPLELVRSIVNDYVSSQIHIGEDALPGIFYLEGAWDSAGVKRNHKEKLEAAKKNQKGWFISLVEAADQDWARSNHNPRSVSSVQKLACTKLGLDREWNTEAIVDSTKNCPLCTSKIPTQAAICPVCQSVLNPDAVKAHEASLAL